MKKQKTLWFMTYSWELNNSIRFADQVTEKHPLEVMLEWAKDTKISEEYRLINFWEIPPKLHDDFEETFI